MSVLLAGTFGTPAPTKVPERSLRRIQRAIFGSEDGVAITRFSFQAIDDHKGMNLTEVLVTPEDAEGFPQVRILYRDGSFWKAFINDGDSAWTESTLSGAITFLKNRLTVYGATK